MTRNFAGLFCGIIFGIGLSISGMINPAKVIGFLDFFGQWDPSLAFVMGGAVGVYSLGYLVVSKRQRPLFDEVFQIPTRKDIDARLISGAVLFGAGWGLAGICPGPAVTILAFGWTKAYVFFIAMAAGVLLYKATVGRAPKAPAGAGA